MRLLASTIVLFWATNSWPQKLPCEFVAEHQLPNCQFTSRSNHALHGPVHTERVIARDLSPDPRIGHDNPASRQKLFIQEPGTGLTFAPDGETTRIFANGFPSPTTFQRTITEGSTTILLSGTAEDPNAFRREEKHGPDGAVTEELSYEHNQLVAHHVSSREGQGESESVEDFLYDGDGKLSSYSIERHDSRGRAIESMVFSGNELVLHVRDIYADSQDCNDDDCALTSRSWYDAAGSMFREITLQDRVATSWWQRPRCGEICAQQSDGVGLNRPFDRTVSYYFERDGTLLTTIEYHPGRYGNIDNDDVELLNSQGKLLEQIAYKYVRDSHDNWTERTASILDVSTGKLVDVRRDERTLTYYKNQR